MPAAGPRRGGGWEAAAERGEGGVSRAKRAPSLGFCIPNAKAGPLPENRGAEVPNYDLRLGSAWFPLFRGLDSGYFLG